MSCKRPAGARMALRRSGAPADRGRLALPPTSSTAIAIGSAVALHRVTVACEAQPECSRPGCPHAACCSLRLSALPQTTVSPVPGTTTLPREHSDVVPPPTVDELCQHSHPPPLTLDLSGCQHTTSHCRQPLHKWSTNLPSPGLIVCAGYSKPREENSCTGVVDAACRGTRSCGRRATAKLPCSGFLACRLRLSCRNGARRAPMCEPA